MFEHLRVHPRIVVTGPQRSGTRIATRMIAADTGHGFVDEVEFGTTDGARFCELLERENVVVQAPHMLKDMVDDPPAGIFVVLMRRDLDKIHASAQRIGWEERYQGNQVELGKFGLSIGDSAAVKYQYWDSHDKRVPYAEVDYELLRDHPLFVPEKRRRHFGPLQTQPDLRLRVVAVLKEISAVPASRAPAVGWGRARASRS